MKRILLTLSMLLCVPQAQADQISSCDTLLCQISNHDATTFATIYKATRLSSYDKNVLIDRAHAEKTKLEHTLRKLSPEKWSTAKRVGFASVLLASSAIIASPIVISGIEARGRISKFFDPKPEILNALWCAMNLAHVVTQSNSEWIQIPLWSSGTLGALYPNNKVLRGCYASCLYALCASASAVAATHGLTLLKQALFDTRNTTQKLKNIDAILTLLTGARVHHMA